MESAKEDDVADLLNSIRHTMHTRKKELKKLLGRVNVLQDELAPYNLNPALSTEGLYEAYVNLLVKAIELGFGEFCSVDTSDIGVQNAARNLRLLEKEMTEELAFVEESLKHRSPFRYLQKEKSGNEVSTLTERDIHPRIIEVSGELFANKHYTEAIFAAFKEVEAEVGIKSRLSDLSGADLMAKAFNLTKPKLKLSKLKNKSDLGEQEGFMHIFRGSMLGIRNPKAHGRVEQKDPIKTLEYLALASLLLRRVDEAEVSEDR